MWSIFANVIWKFLLKYLSYKCCIIQQRFPTCCWLTCECCNLHFRFTNEYFSFTYQIDLGIWCPWQHHNCFTLAKYIAYITIINYLPFHFIVPSAAPISKSDNPSNTIEHQEELMDLLFPNANPTILEFLRMQPECCQAEVEGKDLRSSRWSPVVISTSLSLWVASPVAYRILGNMFYLPTERILQMYKNCIDKDPGVDTPLIHWMSKECERTGTANKGGIIFGEMATQAGV